jgi:CMP-N,N'-diacetyllegionaminic acid synthase
MEAMMAERVVIEIPARLGSRRVSRKNLRLLNGKPMLSYAIEAAKNSSIDEIYVNSDSELIGGLAIKHGVKFYKRAPELAEDDIVSDEFNYDFLKNIKPEVLVMVNPVSPLVTGADIDRMLDYYLAEGLDTLITVRQERLQAFYKGRALNFEREGLLPMTQALEPVELSAWSVSIWRAGVFMESYEKKGYAVFSGRVGLYPMEYSRSLKISTEDDFMIAEALIRQRESGDTRGPEYYEP